MKNKKVKCDIYTRVSTTMQVDGYSLDAQKEKLKRYAEFQNMEIVNEYSDEGKSGKCIEGRPEFQRMLENIENGTDEVQFVLVFKLSRSGRNAVDVLNFEQLVRIFFVIFLYTADAHTAFTPSVAIAVLGIVGGEIAAAFLCIHKLRTAGQPLSPHREPALSAVPPLLFSALPLTASRVLLNLFQSLEAISIPLALQKYGMSISASLSTYGILTGIALPCILFPSALTNSISTMLLPEVASMPDAQKKHALPQLLRKVIFFCLFLGFACLLFFFTASGFISRRIFHTPEAGNYILTLAFICPFLYSNTALISVLNGLDLAGKTFLINLFTLAVRICGVLFLIPQFGILGYLWALLASQLLTFGCCMFLLIKQGR